jgi:hypothetical protein
MLYAKFSRRRRCVYTSAIVPRETISINLKFIIMKAYRGEKKRPVLRILLRLLEHCQTLEEIEYLWQLQLQLLTNKESKTWYIFVYTAYKYSLQSELSK